MKKLPGKIAIVSLLIAANFNLSSGQIFLCENDLPNIGDIAIIVNADSASGASANWGPSGAGVSWNFGTSLFPDYNDTTFYIDPVSTPNVDSFPQAYIAETSTFYPPNGIAYYMKHNTGLWLIGQDFSFSGSKIRHFDPPANTFPFLSYGDTMNETFKYWYRISTDSVQVFYIIRQSIADAWGTITTPPGTTITDVIRIYITETTYDSLYISGVGQQNNVYSGDYYYRWYAKNLGWPVLEIHKVWWQNNVQIAKYASDLTTVPPTPPPPTSIQGKVTYSLGPVINGSVAIYGWNDKGTQMKVLLDATTTDNFGNYTFTNVPSGEHLIVARATALPNTIVTYYGDAFYFDSASTVTAFCDSVFLNADITLLEYSPSSTGPGSISGNIRWWDGPGKTGAPAGDPLPGLDITVEQIPGGTIKGGTLTDGVGDYSFTDLDTGTYKIYVDMTGYPIDTFHIIKITASDTVFTNKDYWASDTSMYIPIPTSIPAIEKDRGIYVKVFPNPFSDETRFEITGYDDNEVFRLEIYDIMGRKVDEMNLTKPAFAKTTAGRPEFIYLRKEKMGTGLYIYKIFNQEGIIGLGKLSVQ